ncbi:hypothetical protein FB157_105318 [Streptomyces sp. BK340]|nr:hypothetical protein FB157_105318 [Streptomyces sp. BK340]
MTQHTRPARAGKTDWAEGGLVFAGVLLLLEGVLAVLQGISAIAAAATTWRAGASASWRSRSRPASPSDRPSSTVSWASWRS